jgi:prepilin-type N-terminal cleavage/methylation domain-containing protein
MVKMSRNGFKIRRVRPHYSIGARGFTLIEILIVVVILGIMATIVVPQMSGASKEARENTLKDELRYLRTQIQVFKAQHGDLSAGYPNGNIAAVPTEAAFLDQMTHCSSEKCATSATGSPVYKLGPYLSRMPDNPINGTNAIKVIPDAAPMPAPNPAEATKYGWIYKPSTQEIIANSTGVDSAGMSYGKY